MGRWVDGRGTVGGWKGEGGGGWVRGKWVRASKVEEERGREGGEKGGVGSRGGRRGRGGERAGEREREGEKREGGR